jgi:hypothetical protein
LQGFIAAIDMSGGPIEFRVVDHGNSLLHSLESGYRQSGGERVLRTVAKMGALTYEARASITPAAA